MYLKVVCFVICMYHCMVAETFGLYSIAVGVSEENNNKNQPCSKANLEFTDFKGGGGGGGGLSPPPRD